MKAVTLAVTYSWFSELYPDFKNSRQIFTNMDDIKKRSEQFNLDESDLENLKALHIYNQQYYLLEYDGHCRAELFGATFEGDFEAAELELALAVAGETFGIF